MTRLHFIMALTTGLLLAFPAPVFAHVLGSAT